MFENILAALFGFVVRLRSRKNAFIAAFWIWLIDRLNPSIANQIFKLIPKFNTFECNLDERPVTCELAYLMCYINDSNNLLAVGDKAATNLKIRMHFLPCTADSLFSMATCIKNSVTPTMVELHIFGTGLHQNGHLLKLWKTETGYEYNVSVALEQSVTSFRKPVLCNQIDLALTTEMIDEPTQARTLAELEAMMVDS